MFGRIEKNSGLLFVTNDLSQILQATAQSVKTEVESLDANRLLNYAPEDLKNYLVEKFTGHLDHTATRSVVCRFAGSPG